MKRKDPQEIVNLDQGSLIFSFDKALPPTLWDQRALRVKLTVSCIPNLNYFAVFTVEYNLQIWPWAASWFWWNDNI